ncbi:hypothetical protein [Croceibacterium xixiisoli]|nr:hypothetical protein [Croceibacterium xixiisoli]
MAETPFQHGQSNISADAARNCAITALHDHEIKGKFSQAAELSRP